MTLETVWFCLIAVLWSGYFLLEGFDFGVGMLLPFLPRAGSERQRAVMFESIGPVWDGNEVWLVVAAGATFAAFPAWYATMFSGFYIALLLILALLIVRVVSFEWREKSEDPRWRSVWLWMNTVGSVGASFIWGVALANLLHGVPLTSSHQFSGDFLDLFSAYTVLAGVTVVCLFALHGATYLSLRTDGDLRERAATTARRLSIPAAVLAVAFLAWTVVVAHNRNERGVVPVADPGRARRCWPCSSPSGSSGPATRAARLRRPGWARSASSRRSSPASTRACSSHTPPSPTASRPPTPPPATTP